MKTKHKMYIIVREDLAMKYVQGGHAAFQFAIEHFEKVKVWKNEDLIYLSVFNGLALENLAAKLAEKDERSRGMFKHSIFVEPDLKSPLPTAICIYENGDGYVSKELEGLRLATK